MTLEAKSLCCWSLLLRLNDHHDVTAPKEKASLVLGLSPKAKTKETPYATIIEWNNSLGQSWKSMCMIGLKIKNMSLNYKL